MVTRRKKAMSLMLSAALIATATIIPTASASAAVVGTEVSGATAGLSSTYFNTNGDGKGKNATITIDGSFSDWNESMRIAQGVANDDPRIFRGSHEGPVYDSYALYGAYDDTNLYLMWEFTNVTDVVDPAQVYPMSDNGKPYQGDIPQMILFDLDPNKSATGGMDTSEKDRIWGMNISYDASAGVDALMCFSSKAGVGQPSLFLTDSNGKFSYDDAYCKGFKASGISFKTGDGSISSKLMGINSNGYAGYTPADLASDSSKWVDFKTVGGHSAKQDTMYEMQVPLSALGIDKNYIESTGIGVMHISTFGESGIASLPQDPTFLDAACEPYSSDESTSAEKADADTVSVPLARIGAGGGVSPIKPTSATQKPTSATSTTTPSGSTGSKSFTVKAGDVVTFSVKATTSEKISAYTLTTNYDSSAFSLYTSYDKDGVSTYASENSKGTEVVNTSTAGKVKTAVLAPSTPYSFTSASRLQMVKLKAKKAGTFTISYTLDELVNSSDKDLVSGGKPSSSVTMAIASAIDTSGATDAPTQKPTQAPTSGPSTGETGSKSFTLKAGDILTFSVKAKSTSSASAFRMTTKYDAKGLELYTAYDKDGVSTLASETGKGTEVVNTSTAGVVKTAVLADTKYSLANTARLQMIKLKAKKAGTYKISYAIDELLDANNKDMVTNYKPNSNVTLSIASAITSGTDTPTSATATEKPTSAPTQGATTAYSSVTVAKGDCVDVIVKVIVPKGGNDVSAWATNINYDTNVFELDKTFAKGKIFAAGTDYVNKALNNLTASYPGGSMPIGNFATAGVAKISDVSPAGFNMNTSKTTKLAVIQLKAKKAATTKVSCTMTAFVDNSLSSKYLSKSQMANGAKASLTVVTAS